jgi:S-adenosylmethionine-diacylgycerolhomoserine-N-methlytransferase
MTAPLQDAQAHRAFLNQYYGLSRHFYDATRKYYLFGRDRALARLLESPWETLIEIGPGTGRNLRKLHEARPRALLGGLEASDAMLHHASQRCRFAVLAQGFAESADLAGLLGERPQRILFSYCLSMIADRERALENARRALAPGGEVVVVDFADLGGLPGPLGRGLSRWLEAFHVRPLDLAQVEREAVEVEFGYGRYYAIARYSSILSG